jgi:hypothetical protein
MPKSKYELTIRVPSTSMRRARHKYADVYQVIHLFVRKEKRLVWAVPFSATRVHGIVLIFALSTSSSTQARVRLVFVDQAITADLFDGFSIE